MTVHSTENGRKPWFWVDDTGVVKNVCISAERPQFPDRTFLSLAEVDRDERIKWETAHFWEVWEIK